MIEIDHNLTGCARIKSLMTVQNKEGKILELLEKNNIVYTSELTDYLSASEATVRRTLAQLEKAGRLRRINGGAVRMYRGMILKPEDEIFMKDRVLVNRQEKRAVAEYACREVQDGECLFLDGGSSIAPMIEFLKDREVRIVTNNHLILSQLDETSRAEVIIAGGIYLKQYAMSVGRPAREETARHTYDRCFLSCMGFDIQADMTYTTEPETADIKYAAAENSRRTVLLAEHSKCGIHGFCKLLPVSSFDAVYCDSLSDQTEPPDNMVLVR